MKNLITSIVLLFVTTTAFAIAPTERENQLAIDNINLCAVNRQNPGLYQKYFLSNRYACETQIDAAIIRISQLKIKIVAEEADCLEFNSVLEDIISERPVDGNNSCD